MHPKTGPEHLTVVIPYYSLTPVQRIFIVLSELPFFPSLADNLMVITKT